MGTMPALSWCGEVALGDNHMIILILMKSPPPQRRLGCMLSPGGESAPPRNVCVCVGGKWRRLYPLVTSPSPLRLTRGLTRG